MSKRSNRDFYSILGVNRDADEGEIRKGYRKQALVWHPDKNPDNVEEAQSKFQEISHAYETLSDPEKKRIYDRFGEVGDNDMPTSNGFSSNGDSARQYGSSNYNDPSVIFRQFFGTSSPFDADGGFQSAGNRNSQFSFPGAGGMHSSSFSTSNRQNSRPMQQEPTEQADAIEYPLRVSLEELYSGATKKVRITKKSLDHRTGRLAEVPVVKEIAIKPGWKDGTRITFERAGDELPNVIPADIIFVIETKKHELFDRVDNDLELRLDISLQSAMSGFTSTVTSIDGERRINISEPYITPQTMVEIANEGMPNQKMSGRFGSLKIKFNIIFPTTLTQQQRNQICDVLNNV